LKWANEGAAQTCGRQRKREFEGFLVNLASLALAYALKCSNPSLMQGFLLLEEATFD